MKKILLSLLLTLFALFPSPLKSQTPEVQVYNMPTPIYPSSLLESSHPYPVASTSWTITPSGWVAGPRYLYITFSNDTVVYRNIVSTSPSNDQITVFTDTESVTYFGTDLAGKTLKLLSTNGLITVTISNTIGTNNSGGGIGGWYGFRITDLAFDSGPTPPQYIPGSPNAFDQPEPYNQGTSEAPVNGEGPNWTLPPTNFDYPVELPSGTLGQSGVNLNYSYQLRTPGRNHMLAPVGTYSPTGGSYVSSAFYEYQNYLVTAVLSSTGYPHETLPSPLVTVVIPTTSSGGTSAGSITVTWEAVPNALYYNVYNIGPVNPPAGSLVNQAFRVTGTSFTDTGATSTYYPQYPPTYNLAVVYTLYGGSLPSGLTLDPAGSGKIYGTPGAIGTFYFSIKAHDLVTATDSYNQYVIKIYGLPVLINTSASLLYANGSFSQGDVDFNPMFHRRQALWQFSVTGDTSGNITSRVYKSLNDGLNLPGVLGSSWVEQTRLSNTADWNSFNYYYDGADTVYAIGKKLSAAIPYHQTQTAFVTIYSYSLENNAWTTITGSYLTINAIDISGVRLIKLSNGNLRAFYIGAAGPLGTVPGTLIPTAENYTISGTTVGTLVPGTAYYYVLTAIIGGVESNVSSEASGTITPGSGDQSIDISWPAMSGVTTFNLYRGTTSGGENVVYTGIPGSATTFHDLGQYYAGAGADTPTAGQPVAGTPPATSFSNLYAVDIVGGVFGTPIILDSGKDFIESGNNLSLTSVTYQAASWNGDGATDIAHLIYTDHAPNTVGGLKYIRAFDLTMLTSSIASYNSYHNPSNSSEYGIINAGNCLLLPQRNEILISMYMPDNSIKYQFSTPGVMRIPLTTTGTTVLGNFEAAGQAQDTTSFQEWGTNTALTIKLGRTRFGTPVLVWEGVSNLVNMTSFHNVDVALFWSTNILDNSTSPWLNWTPFKTLWSTNWNPVLGPSATGAEIYNISLETDIYNFLYVGFNGIVPWDTLNRSKDYMIPMAEGASPSPGGGHTPRYIY